MTISDLVSYEHYSPNFSYGRNCETICKFTPHYVGGNCSLETLGGIFASTDRQASSNYGIDEYGNIACFVQEENRAWTSSSGWNDRKAITVECANYSDGSLSDACWESLVALATDVCTRYGFRLEYTGDRDGSLTEHRMFANTDCPGEWLHGRMAQLAAEVNARLDGAAPAQEQPESEATMWRCVTDPDGNRYAIAADGVHPIENDAEWWAMVGMLNKPADGSGTIRTESIAAIRDVLARKAV